MSGHRYVFVAGLHRSGTSLIARLLAEHPDIAAITDAPVPENEGCYLQGAIPHTARHGVPGHFATDPEQHLVEGSPLDRLETRLRLQADWAPWFNADNPWRVEKSPVNLTHMRLLQSLFPMSQFIVVTRHPAFTNEAMRKWVDVDAIGFRSYWQAAHDIVLADIEYLHGAMIVRYEDLVEQPERIRRVMFAFLDLPLCDTALPVANAICNIAIPRSEAVRAIRGWVTRPAHRMSPFRTQCATRCAPFANGSRACFRVTASPTRPADRIIPPSGETKHAPGHYGWVSRRLLDG